LSLLIVVGVAFAQDAPATEQQTQIIEIIHPKYLDAAWVAQLFGGTVLGNGMAYLPLRGGTGMLNPGARIGGLYNGPRGGLRNSPLNQPQRGYGYSTRYGGGYNPYNQGYGYENQ